MAEKLPRNPSPEQDAAVRAHNFNEVALGYDYETAQKEAARCLNCKNAPCMQGCPVSVRIPEFIAEIKRGNLSEAARIVKSTNSLPSVCGRVCPQEEQCEKLCIRSRLEGAVSIGALERFVGDYALTLPETQPKDEKKNGKVAVVGSGPSGLTCAAMLASNGVEVTVYEAFHRSGGVLVYGIPEFRLPKKLVSSEVDKLRSLGVKFSLNTVIGKTITLPELLEQNDAVFIGSGAGLPMFMNIEGENLNGVLSANEYLTRVNLMGGYEKDSITPVPRGNRVIVVGAGNVAMDAARTALRMGASEVTVVYRRSRDEMPARKEEVRHAEQEGIKFCLLASPIKFHGENGFVTGATCIRTELGEPDASGRRSPREVKGSEFEIAADLVIIALGTSPNPLIKDSFDRLETAKRGILVVDENMMTSVDGVYAGGDAVTGAATVILAMGAGRKAAKAILERIEKSEKKCSSTK